MLTNDTIAYCPAVLNSLLLFKTVTPTAAINVVSWFPFCTIKQLKPSPRPTGMDTVALVVVLSMVTTFPLSEATN